VHNLPDHYLSLTYAFSNEVKINYNKKIICAFLHINNLHDTIGFLKNQLKPKKITIFSFNSAFFIDFFLIIYYDQLKKNQYNSLGSAREILEVPCL